jgi:hypothetical protein
VKEKKRELICCRRHTIRIGAALKSNGKKMVFHGAPPNVVLHVRQSHISIIVNQYAS